MANKIHLDVSNLVERYSALEDLVIGLDYEDLEILSYIITELLVNKIKENEKS